MCVLCVYARFAHIFFGKVFIFLVVVVFAGSGATMHSTSDIHDTDSNMEWGMAVKSYKINERNIHIKLGM